MSSNTRRIIKSSSRRKHPPHLFLVQNLSYCLGKFPYKHRLGHQCPDTLGFGLLLINPCAVTGAKNNKRFWPYLHDFFRQISHRPEIFRREGNARGYHGKPSDESCHGTVSWYHPCMATDRLNWRRSCLEEKRFHGEDGTDRTGRDALSLGSAVPGGRGRVLDRRH